MIITCISTGMEEGGENSICHTFMERERNRDGFVGPDAARICRKEVRNDVRRCWWRHSRGKGKESERVRKIVHWLARQMWQCKGSGAKGMIMCALNLSPSIFKEAICGQGVGGVGQIVMTCLSLHWKCASPFLVSHSFSVREQLVISGQTRDST